MFRRFFSWKQLFHYVLLVICCQSDESMIASIRFLLFPCWGLPVSRQEILSVAKDDSQGLCHPERSEGSLTDLWVITNSHGIDSTLVIWYTNAAASAGFIVIER